MDQLDSIVDLELFSNVEAEEELIKKLFNCQSYKQFCDAEIDLNSDAVKSVFKSATLTYTGTIEAKDVIRSLPPIVSEAEFI